MRKLFVFLILSLVHIGLASPVEAQWFHLELGAGNYGQDGYTQTALRKTVRQTSMQFTNKPNYFDCLPEKEDIEYNPEEQYELLFWTLDELVRRYGPEGVFHVNDLRQEYADFAANQLKSYALKQGYLSVVIESVPGDYELLRPVEILARYNQVQYDSVHLKNPEDTFSYCKIDGEKISTTSQKVTQSLFLLKRLANFSKTGIYLFYIKNFFVMFGQPNCVRFEYKDITIEVTKDWPSMSYVFPDGKRTDKDLRDVYWVAPDKNQNQNLNKL